MASVNVDAELVRQGGVLKKEEKMIELSNGCICCTLTELSLSEHFRPAALCGLLTLHFACALCGVCVFV